MKENLILLLSFLFSIEAMAQNHQIKIGGGLGEVDFNGWNAEIQYERKLSKRLSVFTAVGVIGYSYTVGVCHTFREFNGRWTRCWAFDCPESFIYLDAGFKGRLFRLGRRYEMRAALGGAFARLIYRGPERVTVYSLRIVSEDYGRARTTEKTMFLVGLENRVSLTDRLSISLNANYRDGLFPALQTYEVIANDALLFKGVREVVRAANVTFQLGYAF